MTELSRRTLLTSTVAATAAAVAPLATGRSGHAAAPPAGTQAPGWYRYKLGSFEITVVTDGVNRFKLPDTFVTNKSKAEVNEGLAAAFLQPASEDELREIVRGANERGEKVKVVGGAHS